MKCRTKPLSSRVAWIDRYIISGAILLAVCIGITSRVVVVAVDEWTRSRQVVQDGHADAAMRALKGSVHSAMTAAFSARAMLMKSFGGAETVGWSGLLDMLDALGGTFAPINQSFATWAVLSDHNRTTYEQEFTARCAAALGVPNMTIARLNTTAMSARGPSGWSALLRTAMPPAYPSPTSMYAVVTRYWSGAGTLRESCSNEGLEISMSSERMIALSRSLETGRITWLQQHVTSEKPFKNIGMLVPIHAPSEALAGAAGRLHGQWIATHRNRTGTVSGALQSVCSAPLGIGPDECGASTRAIGVMAIPLYVESALPDVEDVLGVSIGARFTVIEVSSWRNDIKPLVAAEKVQLQHLLTGTTLMPLLPDEYYMDTRTDTYSGLVRKGSVAGILRRARADDVISANALMGKHTWQNSLDPGQALADAIKYDEAADSLQSTYVFILGRRVYFMILRDASETALGPDGSRQMLVSATLGVLCSIMLACVPLIIRYIHDSNAKRTAHALDLVQAERDGVVQAVAFAAHEIRNPMHGVLASLESAFEDLFYLRSLLQRVLGRPDATKEKEAEREDTGQDDAVSHELLALLGHDTCQELLHAIEDVSTAKNSAESCHRLVNDMIDYSKLQRGAMSLQNGDMDVRSGLKRLILGQRGFIASQVSTLIGIDPAVPGKILVDEVRVLQVLTNGLTNAGKFTIQGSIFVTAVIVDSSSYPALCLPHNPRNKWLAITTCDTGKGLSGINVDGLFEPVKATASAPAQPIGRRSPIGSANCVSCLRSAATDSSTADTGSSGAEVGGAATTSGSPRHGKPVELETHSQDSGSPDTVTETGLSASSIAKSRGSGLGLPVARLMARALGGDIDLYTEVLAQDRQYTRFLFLLPLGAVTRNSDGSHPVVEPFPLFGRTGRLEPTARAEMRALVSKRIREMRDQPGDFYTPIKNGRQGSISTGKHSQHTMQEGPEALGPVVVDVDESVPTATATEADLNTPATTSRSIPPVSEALTCRDEPKSVENTARPNPSTPVSHLYEGGSKVGLSAIQLLVATPDQADCHFTGDFLSVRADSGVGRSSASEQLTNYMLSARAPGFVSAASEQAQHASLSPASVRLLQSGPSVLTIGAATSDAVVVEGREAETKRESGQASSATSRSQPSGGSSEFVRRSEITRSSASDSFGRPRSPVNLPPAGAAVGSGVEGDPGIALLSVPLTGRTLRVLYAEDDATNRRLMDRMVNRLSKASMQQGGPVQLVAVEDGWGALCQLYLHGHIERGTIANCYRQLTGTPAVQGHESRFLLPVELNGPPLPPFDLICLDNEMPILNGSSVAAVLREAQHKGEGSATAHVPVVAVTGMCSGFTVRASYVESCAMPLSDVQLMMPSVCLSPQLGEDEFRQSFIGTLGKPYKADDLAGLLVFARAVKTQMPRV